MNRTPSVILLLMLSGCATNYQPQGMTGGFSETQLAPNVYRVTFRGNGHTDPDRANDFALLRASELTLAKGDRYFLITEVGDRTTSAMYRTPTTTTANATGYGNSAYGNAVTSGGALVPIIKPGVAFTITTSLEKPESQAAFDAEFLAKSLKTKYKIP